MTLLELYTYIIDHSDINGNFQLENNTYNISFFRKDGKNITINEKESMISDIKNLVRGYSLFENDVPVCLLNRHNMNDYIYSNRLEVLKRKIKLNEFLTND